MNLLNRISKGDIGGGSMTKEQVQEEYVKLRQEHYEERNRIMKEAEEKGLVRPGLDGNRDLFIEIEKEYWGK